MKKTYLLFIIVVLAIAMAAVDYFINGSSFPAPAPGSSSAISVPESYQNIIESVFSHSDALSGYQLEKRDRTQHLFEKVAFDTDLSLAIFYNLLKHTAAPPIEFYEVHGPKGQGNLTYFKVKQRFLEQVTDATASINEVGAYGQNSFFYNDLNYKSTAFLIVQIGDNVYGIKYNKDFPETFERVKKAIRYLMDNKITPDT